MPDKPDQSDPQLVRWGRHVREDEDLLKGFARLAALNPDLVERLAGEVAKDYAIDDEIVDAVAAKAGLASNDVRSGIEALVSFFINLPQTITPERGIQHLHRVGALAAELEAPLLERLSKVETIKLQKALKEVREIGRAAAPAFPTLKGFWTRCVGVAVFEPEYSLDDDPGTYTPSLSRLAPMVVVQLDIDAFGDTQRFAFRLNERELDQMIHRLRLAQKQFLLTKNGLKKMGVEKD